MRMYKLLNDVTKILIRCNKKIRYEYKISESAKTEDKDEQPKTVDIKPVMFENVKSGRKYYYDPNSDELVGYKENNKANKINNISK